MKRILLALVAVATLALTPHSPVFTDGDSAQPIVVKVGEEFFIALPSNKTTGYAWTATIGDEKLTAYEGNVYQNPSSGLIGAGGQQIFIFHANRTGTTTITFAYARSFETNTAPAKTLSFSLSIQ